MRSALARTDANEAVKAEDATRAICTLNLMKPPWGGEPGLARLVGGHQPDDLLPAPAEAEEAIGSEAWRCACVPVTVLCWNKYSSTRPNGAGASLSAIRCMPAAFDNTPCRCRKPTALW
ncbi:hypothetical protein [Xylella fastidiosa]|uniref:hypothetical protein n=1 Tax=Xylella fastidiosa TaxID=2371 RepID=UPI0039851F1A